MTPADPYGTINLDYVEDIYQQWCEDPTAVDAEWRSYFERQGNGGHAARGPSFAPRSIFNPPAEVGGPAAHGRLAEMAAVARSATQAIRARTRLGERVEVAAGDLTRPEDRVPILRTVGLFGQLEDDHLRRLAEAAREVTCSDGQLIFREGDVDHEMYVIVEGKVIISSSDRVLAELGPGEAIGEMTILDDHPRSADGRAEGNVRLLELSGKILLDELSSQPQLAFAMLKNLSKRLRKKNVKQDAVDQLIRSYRVRGHLLAKVDPLDQPRKPVEELELEFYGLGERDLDTMFSSTSIAGTSVMTLREILGLLKHTYCGSIGAQYMHIDDPAAKFWIRSQMENIRAVRRLSRDEQLRTLGKLCAAEQFEQFIHRKFLGKKRFSLEGAETLIPLLDLAIDEAGEYGVGEIVIGMPHRGRLNVLANTLGKDPMQIFREFDEADAHLMRGRGDVKYHLGFSNDITTSGGKRIHLSLTFNPSHLECVTPVVMGRVRAKQDRRGDRQRRQVMGIAIHGDSAFAGQGVTQELFNLSELHGYRSGGTLHIIVNNQIGFTTPPEQQRSTTYCTDVTKMLQTPIFHVNGEHPEAVAQVVRWAMAYRAQFRKDVIIDMYCFRKYGHNEGDEPAFTQPQMYKKIRARRSVVDAFQEKILSLGDVTRGEANRLVEDARARYDAAFEKARSGEVEPEVEHGHGYWSGYVGGPFGSAPEVPTRVPAERLRALLERTIALPDDFHQHDKMERILLGRRRSMAAGEQALDWSAGEALAFATLVTEGHPVRLSGQDAQRGTFAHRHAVLHDVEDEAGREYCPLQWLESGQAPFRVYNSPLSETGVLGFDYGYSLDTPEGLTIWEAQFGDFCNVAQVIIDQFITSAEDKWDRLSNLTMLLPHGFEGQGPEHSSARLERWLSLAADDNCYVVNLTTPAQIFHALRRQVKPALRKPLIVMSPKSLLRHPNATSTLDELSEGAFRPVIGDTTVDPAGVRRILLTSGKMYYDLTAGREERQNTTAAIVRVEQYYPLPMAELEAELGRYPQGAELVWVQEEPRNMGAWPYLRLHLGETLLGRPLAGLAREESASPATGSKKMHDVEQAELVEAAFVGS